MLSIRAITKDYDGAPLLRGVSLEAAAGEVLCLLGPEEHRAGGKYCNPRTRLTRGEVNKVVLLVMIETDLSKRSMDEAAHGTSKEASEHTGHQCPAIPADHAHRQPHSGADQTPREHQHPRRCSQVAHESRWVDGSLKDCQTGEAHSSPE